MAATKGQPAPKPGSVPSPVPQDDLASAAAAFMQKQGSVAMPDVPSADVGAEEAYSAIDLPADEPPAAPGFAGQALDAAGRGLDYLGGITRTGLAGVAGAAKTGYEAATGQPLSEPVAGPADVVAAAKGKAPDTAEYLRRLGVPEGLSFKVGDTKITARGAAGLAGDIASDPLTVFSKLIKSAPYIGKLVGQPGKAAEALGEAVYKSALPKGAEEAAEALVHAGAPVGGTAKLAAKVDEMSESIGKIRQGLYDKATELGVTIDTGFPLKRAEAVLSGLKTDPGLAPVVEDLRTLLNRYKEAGKVPIDVMSEWKTNLYDALPAHAFDGHGKLKNKAKMFKQALAADFREAIVHAGNTAEKGLGDAINALNEKWGSLLGATRPLEKAQKTTGGGKLGAMIDGAVLGAGGLKGVAVKKAYDLATTPYARTLVGRALIEGGKTGLADALVRRAVIEAGQPPASLQANEEEEQ